MIRRALDYAANEIPMWAWFVVVLLLFAALTGCPAPHPAPVFALAVEPLPLPTPPTVPEAAATADACPDGYLLPGEPLAPELATVVRGLPVAACRGQVISDAQQDAYFRAEDDARMWHDLAVLQWQSRAADRALCEEVAGQRAEDVATLRRDGRALRWAGFGLGFGGLLVGLAVGVGVGAFAVEVVP